MKKIFSLVVLIVLVVVGYNILQNQQEAQEPIVTSNTEDLSDVAIVASNLEIPWDIAFLPDGSMLVTERTGALLHIEKSGTSTEIALKRAETRGESGLHTPTLHRTDSSTYT